MAGLLVSVRSAGEALAAVRGGASVIDVKEPARGPLGRAEQAVWRAIRAVVPSALPVSVALGELREWPPALDIPPPDWSGIAWRKLGLSGLADDLGWPGRWAALRAAWGPGPGWVAVAYADADQAGAPDPDAVIDAALAGGCSGVLVDTWDKSRPSPLAPTHAWRSRLARARAGGLLVALAGGLDPAAIARLAPLEPDWFAVRGAACGGPPGAGARLGSIDVGRVAALVRAAAGSARQGNSWEAI